MGLALIASLVALAHTLQELRRSRDRVDALEAQLATPASPDRTFADLAVRAMKDTATRMREGGMAGMLLGSMEDLSHWATEGRAEIVRTAASDGTVTIFFSDIEDSTALNERLGDRDWLKVLQTHDRIVREAVAAHRGRVVKTQGDSFMVAFRDAAQAVHAAVQIQHEFAVSTRRHLRRTPIRVRIGIHRGEVVSRDGDYFGRNVAMAARVASAAEGGQILVSDVVHADLETDGGFEFPSSIEVELKGLQGTFKLWLVTSD